jgi:CDP-glucose 4,6-dehydratase
MRSPLFVVLLALPTASQLPAQRVALTHVNVVNVDRGSIERDKTILIDSGRVVVVGDARSVRLPKGTPERDYIYAPDAVDAYLAIAKSLDDSSMHGRAWNAGAGRPYSVREIVDRLVAVSGRDAEPDVQGEGTPHGEIDRQFLDSTRIREELGWEPRWELDDGLRETWAWYEQHLGRD